MLHGFHHVRGVDRNNQRELPFPLIQGGTQPIVRVCGDG
jgi:hypothetical protein